MNGELFRVGDDRLSNKDVGRPVPRGLKMTKMSTEVLFPKEVIDRRVRELAGEISRDYEGRELLIVGILKGAFVFMADLIRLLEVPCKIDFVRLASYGSQSVSSGEIRIGKDLETPIAGCDVLIVEDIVDTGLTLSRFVGMLQERQPATLRVCVFLDKPERRQVPFTADYVGFSIPDRFVVGYGLDYDERFRFLPDVCVLATPPEWEGV
jgi:hypoxanthine phosphoribosyltransferase